MKNFSESGTRCQCTVVVRVTVILSVFVVVSVSVTVINPAGVSGIMVISGWSYPTGVGCWGRSACGRLVLRSIPKTCGSNAGFEGETEGNSVDVTKMVVKSGPSELIV